MKRYQVEATVVANTLLNRSCYLLEVQLPPNVGALRQARAGMFAQLLAPTQGVLLRRPISIAFYDRKRLVMGFLIQIVGKASSFWSKLAIGDKLDLLGPLGNTFTTSPSFAGERPLLVGGGVGIAPMRMLAEEFSEAGITPTVLCGTRTKEMLIFRKELRTFGNLFLTTEDGSDGIKGFVTDHPLWREDFTAIYTCGPELMMKAVAAKAKQKGIACEISLENKMACGIGACLCCVEMTVEGNLCTCTEGPVFNSEKLLLA